MDTGAASQQMDVDGVDATGGTFLSSGLEDSAPETSGVQGWTDSHTQSKPRCPPGTWSLCLSGLTMRVGLKL